jgi:hypothetical protein
MEEGNWQLLHTGTSFLIGVMEVFWNLIVGIVTQLCEYTKNY